MTPPDDHEADRFFEQLGSGSDNPGHDLHASSASALRNALRAEAATLNDARQASPDDLSAQERAILGAMKQRLLAEGVLGGPQSTYPEHHQAADEAEPGRFGFGRWLRTLLLGEGAWWRPAGMAASVVLVGLLALQLGVPTPSDDHDRMRSGEVSELVVVDSNPVARAEDLAVKLRAAGATVVVAPINDKETMLVVGIEDAARLPEVHAMVLAAGVRVGQQPEYRISVRTPR